MRASPPISPLLLAALVVTVSVFGCKTTRRVPSSLADADRFSAAGSKVFDRNLTRAQAGDVEAMFGVALAYDLGEGVEENDVSAVEWYRRAAAAGDLDATRNLGMMYAGGEGVPANPTKAVHWYRAAAELGGVEAMRLLVGHLTEGLGTPQDDGEAAEWLRRAFETDASADDALALGYGYARGGVNLERDPAESTIWLRRAAELGSAVASYELARRAIWGIGGDPDPRLAASYRDEARDRGLLSADHLDPTLPSFSRASLRPVDCWFEAPTGQEAICARVTMPQVHDDAGSPDLEFPLVILPAPGTTGEFVLVPGGGGPGNGVGLGEHDTPLETADVGSLLDYGFDVVIVDQRGAGESDPCLECPDEVDAYKTFWESPASRAGLDATAQAILACAARWEDRGVRLEAFTTATSARDLDELRMALGIRRWNLLGTSYAGLLALRVARDYPDTVRSLVLDSPASPVAPPYLHTALADRRAVVARLARACRDDVRCFESYGDLEVAVLALYDELNHAPVTLSISDPDTLQPRRVLIDGERFVELLFSASYWNLEEIPRLITATRNGSLDFLTSLARQILSGFHFSREYGDLLSWTIHCAEEWPRTDAEELKEQIRSRPLGYSGIVESLVVSEEVCPVLARGVPPDEPWDLGSIDAPTLVLAGRLDPTTPAQLSRKLAEGLPSAWYQELGGCGHSVLGCSLCAHETLVRFLQTPDEDPRTRVCRPHEQRLWWLMKDE